MTRKTPLRRRTRLKPVSAKKQSWRALYRAKKESDAEWQKCPCCNGYRHKSTMEPHHPMGQVGERILVYVWICPKLHRWIHDNGKLARALGYIMPEFDGRKSTPETPNFFNTNP